MHRNGRKPINWAHSLSSSEVKICLDKPQKISGYDPPNGHSQEIYLEVLLDVVRLRNRIGTWPWPGTYT